MTPLITYIRGSEVSSYRKTASSIPQKRDHDLNLKQLINIK
ncbi:putative orphan protein [Pseudoalteromonas translucida]|uniref:Orphan protein n=1 Tax=Pseudoalteromonas translucida (strain TAC 125) TaxID=326442 RepID=Q3IKL1_PSET1|nr:putative orphan protein [Pseudoalteromonas translucida]